MISINDKKMITNFLKSNVAAELIYIFGSYAKGTERVDSDLDIAFLSEMDVEEYQLFLLAQKLADKLKKEVDLIDIKKATTVFKVQIIQGQLIYCNNYLKKMQLELKTLREYTKLNEERKNIISNVMKGEL